MEEQKNETKEKEELKKEYKEERFEISVYINDFVVCKRNFRINGFIEGSMMTEEFHKMMRNGVATLIKNDLASKARTYMWYCFGPSKDAEGNKYYEEIADEEYINPVSEPYTDVIRVVVTDNRRTVYEMIIDASVYPKMIRDRIDLTNKQEGIIRTVASDGTVIERKIRFDKMDLDRMNFENYVIKAMVSDKKDVMYTIMRLINETCSKKKVWTDEETGLERVAGMYSSIDEFETAPDYTNKVYDGHGNYKVKGSVRYPFLHYQESNYLTPELKEKTKKYFDENKYWM